MRLFIATSVDGFIAGDHGNLDWMLTDQDYGFQDFIANVDSVLMSERTYQTARKLDIWPYKGLGTWVMCIRPRAQDDPEVNFTSAPPADIIERLRKMPGRDLWLIGGGQTIKSFLAGELIDEITLAVHPIILGGGSPLFPEGTVGVSLELLHSQAYATGLVSLTYRVRHLDD